MPSPKKIEHQANLFAPIDVRFMSAAVLQLHRRQRQNLFEVFLERQDPPPQPDGASRVHRSGAEETQGRDGAPAERRC